jgi:hypothetical protein
VKRKIGIGMGGFFLLHALRQSKGQLFFCHKLSLLFGYYITLVQKMQVAEYRRCKRLQIPMRYRFFALSVVTEAARRQESSGAKMVHELWYNMCVRC